MIDALAARIKLAAGDATGAAEAYASAVKKYPQARYLQFALADVLQVIGRHAEALSLLREQAQLYRSDARVYEMQAKSFAATGKVMAQHQALGEYYALIGSPQAAIEQFQIARCSRDGDFYQQSIIDSRIRALWDQVVAERVARAETGQSAAGPGPPQRAPLPVQLAPTRCQ